MVRELFFKMLRDMKRSGMTYVLCIFIVAVGYCGYSALSLASADLFSAQEQYMRDTAFPDVFAEVERAPLSVAEQLEEIPGVQSAQGRLVKTVRVARFGTAGEDKRPENRTLRDTEETIDAKIRLYSVQEGTMNVPLVHSGRMPAAGERELLLGDGMAQAKGMEPGGSLELMIGRTRTSFAISGAGSTPENIYLLEHSSDLFPVPERFGAGFLDYGTMARLFSMEGLANSFELRLSSGVELPQIESEIREVLKPYSCYGIYDRSGELSTAMLQTELEQLGKMTGVLPTLFLTVAAVILSISLGRMIEQQRPQIGMLMAMGFGTREIRRHYSLYGAVTGLVGGMAGTAAGYLLSGPMAGFYREYFRLPISGNAVSLRYFFIGMLTAAAFCGGVSCLAAGRISRLSPAMALRPAAPKAAEAFVLERIPGFSGLFTEPGLMALRSLVRNPKKTLLSIFGISFAFMITASLVSMNTLYDAFIFDYWEKTQRQDLTVRFDGYVREDKGKEAVRRDGIRLMEGILELPVTLKGRYGKKDGMIQGIGTDPGLCLLYSEDGQRVSPDGEGILLSRHMADLLGTGEGESVTVIFRYPEETSCQVRVDGIITQYMGENSYMDKEAVGRLSGLGPACSALLIQASEPVQREICEKLVDAPSVISVESRGERTAGMRKLIGSLSGLMGAMAAMGVIISTAVFYISSLIGFEEMKRELAVLLTLGVPQRSCLDVVAVSQWILAAGGVLLGIPFTMLVSRLISAALISDLYSMPSFVDGRSLAQAAALTAVSVFISTRIIFQKIKRLTPGGLLRERE